MTRRRGVLKLASRVPRWPAHGTPSRWRSRSACSTGSPGEWVRSSPTCASSPPESPRPGHPYRKLGDGLRVRRLALTTCPTRPLRVGHPVGLRGAAQLPGRPRCGRRREMDRPRWRSPPRASGSRSGRAPGAGHRPRRPPAPGRAGPGRRRARPAPAARASQHRRLAQGTIRPGHSRTVRPSAGVTSAAHRRRATGPHLWHQDAPGRSCYVCEGCGATSGCS